LYLGYSSDERALFKKPKKYSDKVVVQLKKKAPDMKRNL